VYCCSGVTWSRDAACQLTCESSSRDSIRPTPLWKRRYLYCPSVPFSFCKVYFRTERLQLKINLWLCRRYTPCNTLRIGLVNWLLNLKAFEVNGQGHIVGLWATKSEGVVRAISFQDFQLCDHDPPTSQTNRRTTCNRKTTRCTCITVHRAVKRLLKYHCLLKHRLALAVTRLLLFFTLRSLYSALV